MTGNDMSRISRSWLIGCVVAFASTAAMMLSRVVVADFSGQRVPLYLSLVAAVFAAAAYGGLKAGLTATGLCIAVGVWLFPSPPESVNPASNNRGRMLLFLVEGLAISGSFEAMHRARQRMQEKQVQLEAEIRERKSVERELVKAACSKNHFLATLAHELRNPLAPLRNCVEIMRLASGDSSRMEQACGVMERQVNQLARLVEDLLDVSRISRGKVELRKERLVLGEILQRAVEMSRPLVEAAGHDVLISMPNLPIFVEADPVRLIQVFSNLVNNAAKYMERGGHISITVQHLRNEVKVSVRDNGIGIPSNMLTQVFEMFTQVDQSRSRSQGGLGIGLTLVKRLVELHAGSVEALSEGPDKGSEFVVRLPCSLPAPINAPERSAVAGAGGLEPAA
jgi:signal transduction histidine kinase